MLNKNFLLILLGSGVFVTLCVGFLFYHSHTSPGSREELLSVISDNNSPPKEPEASLIERKSQSDEEQSQPVKDTSYYYEPSNNSNYSKIIPEELPCFTSSFQEMSNAYNQNVTTTPLKYTRNAYRLNFPCFTSSYILLGATIGQGLGYDHGHGTVGAFIAPLNSGYCSWMPFVDVRGHRLKDKKWAVNAGIGLRWADSYSGRVWGANIYYDYRNLNPSNFNQVGIGVESLGSCWDFRINGYFPVGHKEICQPCCTFTYPQGGYVMTCNHCTFALGGADAEVGTHLLKHCAWDLYAAVGTYYFENRDISDYAWGGRARVGVFYGDYISLEARATYDRVYQNKVQGVLNLTIPFDLFNNNCCPCTCNCILNQPVIRNDLILIDRSCCWDWNF